MVRTLIKKQLLELFQTYVIDRKTGKARSKRKLVSVVIFAVLLFVCLGAAFFGMATGLGAAILGSGFNWLYFALMGLLAIALGVFGSVFNTYASLYLPKDNEALLALPIPSGKLLLARVTGVYVTSLLYSAWVWIPVMIAAWIQTPVTAAGVVFPVLLTFVIALFVTVLSCALGWVVALIASKTKGKSFLTVGLSLLFLAAYYVVYFRIANSLGEIIENLDTIGENIRSWLGYVYLLGKAADGDALSMLLFTVITFLLAGICLFVLSKTFMRVAVSDSPSRRKTQREEGYRRFAPRRALLRREFRHFTSTATWMLNGGLGLLIMPVAAIFILIKGGTIREALAGLAGELPGLVSAVPVFVLVLLGMIVSINVISAASVSLEGKSLWLLQTLPVDAWEILRAKERMDVLLNVFPALFSVLALGAALRLKPWDVLLIGCALLFYVWLKADLGLMLDLKHPNLNWTNVAVPTKQNLSVIFQMFGGWLLCVILGAAGFFAGMIMSVTAVLGCCAALIGVICLLLHRWLKKKGARILATL